MSGDLRAAQQAVATFHSQLDSEQYDTIFQSTSDDFRKATTDARFMELLRAIHKKLGKVLSTSQQNYRINFTTGAGEVISLQYHTEFEGGSSVESFLWQFQDKRALLLGYNINSDELILK